MTILDAFDAALEPARLFPINDYCQDMLEIAYGDTVDEAFCRGASPLTAHKEGVVAASMLLSALTGVEDEPAKRFVVALGLRPQSTTLH